MIQESVSTYNPEISSGEHWLESLSGTDLFSQFEMENLDAPWTIESDDVFDDFILPKNKYYLANFTDQNRTFKGIQINPKENALFYLNFPHTHELIFDKLKLYSLDLLSSTSKEEEHPDLYHQIDNLFDIEKDDEFEDGMENKFSKLLIAFIEKYEKKAIEELTPIFIEEEKNAEIISEALRWIGRMYHNATHSDRLWLLLRCLFCSSPYIRDGALLGLESMNDLGAINSLRNAIKKEKYFELKKDMEKVLHQLETNLDGVNFKDC